jgi:LacI family transcriptional regulator
VAEITKRAVGRGKRPALAGGRPTLRTIAEMTGLAITTISRALNNAPELSQETRERVQKIAAEIGYVPDRTALRLKTGRTHVISLILDPHDEILGFGQSMVAGLSAALHGTPYNLVITPSFSSSDPAASVQHIIRNRMADGIIFSRTERQDPRVRLLLEQDFPFVSHGRTEFATPHPYVDYDNHAFAYQAVRRMAAKGRKKLTIVLPPMHLTFGTHLRDGFLAAVKEFGLAYELSEAMTLDSTAEEIRRVTTERIGRPDAPDGFICSGDTSALAVMAGITDAGLTIGGEIDVVAKQITRIFSLVRPRVDAIHEDTTLAGQQMGELLLRRIAGEPAASLQILHVPESSF